MGCASSSASSSRKFHDQYRVGELIGEGACAQVFVAHKRTCLGGELVLDPSSLNVERAACLDCCVKVLNTSSESSSEERQHARWAAQEAMLWQQIGQHENCVELIHTFVELKSWYMVMEKCDGSLYDRWTRVQEMLRIDCTRVRVLREMILGVAHVHSLGIIHRDIKVENFLLGGPAGDTVKLADFGFATRMPSTNFLTGECGTAPYMSPEMLAGLGYGHKSDVWSLGCTVHVLVHSVYPYNVAGQGAKAMKEAIRVDSPKLNLSWADASDGSFAFIKGMLERTQLHRHTAQQVLSLPSLNQTSSTSCSALCEVRRMQKLVASGARKSSIPMQTQCLPPVASEEERPAVSIVKSFKASAVSVLKRADTQSTNADSFGHETCFTVSRQSSPSDEAYAP